MLTSAKIAQDLKRREATLVAVIVEDKNKKLQLIQYSTGTDGEPVVKFISAPADNFRLAEHISGSVHRPVCDIGKP
jgi:ferritin